jgi:phage/plasmid-associated DNA primase
MLKQIITSVKLFKLFKMTNPNERSCSNILDCCKHIFGSQYELGLDYIQLLYQKPLQRLPILCLVSSENQTGKSTFIYLLKQIFFHRCVIVSSEDFVNPLNIFFANNLLICCEESLFDKNVAVEQIKRLSTADTVTINQKGKDLIELDFFAKFIFTSNHRAAFDFIHKNDQRFWVIDVPKVKHCIINMPSAMSQEIPAFLYYLDHRTLSTTGKSRLWFDYKLYTNS